MSSVALAYVRLGSRALQLVFSLLALATTSAGFKNADSYVGESASLGSSSTTFTILMTYTALLYSLWFLLGVEIFHVSLRPQIRVEQGADALLAVLLLIAGIAQAASDYVHHCDNYGSLLHCNNLKAGVVFTFLAMAAFLATVGLTFVPEAGANGAEAIPQEQYVAENTPTNNNLSPIGSPTATKV